MLNSRYERVIEYLGNHPDLIVLIILFILIYEKFKNSIILHLVNQNCIIIISLTLYFVILQSIGIINVISNLQTFIYVCGTYTLLQTFIYIDILKYFGKNLGSWSIGTFDDIATIDYWLVILSYIPIIGTIPITIRIYQKLVELEKEMKKQGVTNLIDFKPLEKYN
jgi:hypothetical protein